MIKAKFKNNSIIRLKRTWSVSARIASKYGLYYKIINLSMHHRTCDLLVMSSRLIEVVIYDMPFRYLQEPTEFERIMLSVGE